MPQYMYVVIMVYPCACTCANLLLLVVALCPITKAISAELGIETLRMSLEKSNRKAMNRNWSNQKANPALKTKAGNK